MKSHDNGQMSAKTSTGKNAGGKQSNERSNEQSRDMQTAEGTAELRHDDSEAIGSKDQRDQADGSISNASQSSTPENDRDSRVAEGNYNAADGHHTEEVPRTKGKNGNRVSTTDGSWSSTSKSKADKH